ncbi:MAG: LysR family transcriptional regulator [Micrococcaceae bacterium]
MDQNHLRIFLTVAEELHFGRAAEKLFLAQPAVSRAIAQLERSLGVSLFDRTTRRVRLTAPGEQLVTSGSEIMKAIDEAEALVLAAQEGHRGHLSVVFAGLSTHRLIASLSRELKQRYPGIGLSLFSQNFAQQALHKVADEGNDIGLGRWDFIPSHLDSRIIAEERLVLAVPATHELAGSNGATFADLGSEVFVELENTQSVLHDRLRRLSRQFGYEPNIAQRAPDTWTALTLVGAGIGCHLTLDSVQRNFYEDDVAFVPVADDADSIRLQMAWLPENRNPVLRHVLTLIDEIWPAPE